MSLSSLNKEVCTNLFRMLAVNEQTAEAVKRDHASYAKLSLLKQQMNLVQQQAKQVVVKTEAKAKSETGLDLQWTETCTELSAEYDEGTKRLLSMLAVNENTLTVVTRSDTACSKLSMLADQVGLLQQQAQEAVNEAELNRMLTQLGMTSKIVPGTVYYHYTQNGRQTLSRIADNEWSNYEVFHGKYLYDFDLTFRKLAGDAAQHEDSVLPQMQLTIATLEEDRMEHCAPEPAVLSAPITAGSYAPVSRVHSRW